MTFEENYQIGKGIEAMQNSEKELRQCKTQKKKLKKSKTRTKLDKKRNKKIRGSIKKAQCLNNRERVDRERMEGIEKIEKKKIDVSPIQSVTIFEPLLVDSRLRDDFCLLSC